MSSGEVGSLEAAAIKRRERLAALRGSKATKSAPQGQTDNEKDKPLPAPLFRSYKPADDSLKELILPEIQPGEVRDKVKDELDNEHEGVVMDNLDFTNLAPRKPDWDLKRDIAGKLDKLERRTQKAIAELIRERLKEEDLANAVAAGSSAAQQLAQDEED